MFFDPRRYDLAKVGRYKFNKKLALKNRITGHTLAEDVVDAETGEILAEAGAAVDKELAETIQNAGVPFVWIQGVEHLLADLAVIALAGLLLLLLPCVQLLLIAERDRKSVV